MTLSGHLAVSALTLQYIDNPPLLIAVNLILHPLLDMVPHAEWTSFGDSKSKAIFVTILDYAVAIGFILAFVIHVDRPVWLIVAALLAGLWLDILDPLGRWWPSLRYYHQYTHTWPQRPPRQNGESVDWSRSATGKTPMWLKYLIQYGLVVVAAALLWTS